MAFVIRGATKGISRTLGLVGEKYYDRKERKAALAAPEQGKEGSDVPVSEADPSRQASASEDELASDERVWALDEAAGEPPSYEESEFGRPVRRPTADRTISELVHDTVATILHEESMQEHERVWLPYPIIIPQRRPGTKGRGFARAYPPALEAFNINQEAFLHFLESFDAASEASPWLRTLYISAGVVGLVPNHITMAVSISVQVAAGTAIELQSRYRANAFLDQMNKEVFMPLGLYVMVLLCKDGPGTAENPEFGFETVNLENAKQIAKWGLPKENEEDEIEGVSKTSKVLRPIRLVSGHTPQHKMQNLEIAPLVYPGLEDMVERPAINRDESFKERLMRNKAFVADYFDRRARAEYMGNNPDNVLTKASSTMPEFHTRFGDPNHPANNGHLVSLVTGGKLVAQPRGRRHRLREVGEDGKLKPKVKTEHKIRGPISLIAHPIHKVLQKNVLYLTVVNMPSEAEMAEAREALNMDSSSFKDLFKSSSNEQEKR
ncbi:hypothetical protein BDV96DRAFT_591682 [Lophiotrema nucula]|uniref:Uncharacterized protein n=1 Tax=Lophiotrema nucula TaxID=690887 RepID=A0A6A5YH12_9PLEO|nr:hypothetical protein BDV96DRAFT_591682 [Lophiotrema nucula]